MHHDAVSQTGHLASALISAEEQVRLEKRGEGGKSNLILGEKSALQRKHHLSIAFAEGGFLQKTVSSSHGESL